MFLKENREPEIYDDLWVTDKEASAGVKKSFLLDGKWITVNLPKGIRSHTVLRLSRLKRSRFPFVTPRDLFVRIHIFETYRSLKDCQPYSDDRLNILVERLVPHLRILAQIEPAPLYKKYEETLSSDEYAQAIFSHLSMSPYYGGHWDPNMARGIPITFADLEGEAGRIRATEHGENFVIEVKKLYRYHVRMLGAILAHELMHLLALQSGFARSFTVPEVLVGESIDARPTKEVMIDIGCILAGAGRLFEEAVCVSAERAREIFGVGYISPSMISKARSLADDILTNGLGRIQEKRLERTPKVYD